MAQLVSNAPVRQTEMSKAICSLHAATDVLSDRLETLRTRLECVSTAKPKKNVKAENTTCHPPSLIQDIRRAEERIQRAYGLVIDILEDIEL